MLGLSRKYDVQMVSSLHLRSQKRFTPTPPNGIGQDSHSHLLSGRQVLKFLELAIDVFLIEKCFPLRLRKHHTISGLLHQAGQSADIIFQSEPYNERLDRFPLNKQINL